MSTSGGAPMDLLERALACSSADEVEAAFSETREGATRFANNAITQNVSRRTASITVRSIIRGRVGAASGTDLTPEGIAEIVARSEALARVSEPDPELLPLPGPQSYAAGTHWDPTVAAATPGVRSDGVREATRLAAADGLKSAGSFTTSTLGAATANSSGLRFEQQITQCQFVMTAMSDDSSGWSQNVGVTLAEADPNACARRAIDKALLSREPQTIPPGNYTLVLEPAAVGDFFVFLSYALDARAADEGRSAPSGLRESVVGTPLINLYSDPDHAIAPAFRCGEDGLPLGRSHWIRDGRLEEMSRGRFWAGKTGLPFTGKPANLVLAGGQSEVQDLVRTVERGILVTRFWYIRFVDPMKLLLTGMTRDGLFWIENGEVKHGLRNMRFNESPLRCLSRVTALGESRRTGRYLPCSMPALRVEEFQFSSGTAF